MVCLKRDIAKRNIARIGSVDGRDIVVAYGTLFDDEEVDEAFVLRGSGGDTQ